MSHDFYINQPMQMIELNLNKKIDENPHLIYTLDRNPIHPLIEEYSYIRITNYNHFLS